MHHEARTAKGDKASQRNQVFAATPKFGFKPGPKRSGGKRGAHRRHNSIKSSCESSARRNRGSVITKRVFEVGRAFMWGSGKDGRCGNGKEQSERVPSELSQSLLAQLECGYHHSAGLTKDGVLLTWGRGVFG